jgi:hypothetical protein
LIQTECRRIFASTVVVMLWMNVAGSTPARAFAPEAAAAVAGRISAALPPAARWETPWNEAAAVAVASRLAAEDADPEASAPLHRYEAAPSVLGASGVGAIRDAAVNGSAPDELTRAATELGAAFGARDGARIVAAAARVAVSATDLADPFQTTSFDVDETPGGRAGFCDAIDAAELASLDAQLMIGPFDVTAAGRALAEASATRRPDIEAAVARGDDAMVRAIRRERLAAALALARAIVRQAWESAGEPALAQAATPGLARVSPNPARAGSTISFTLAASGSVRAEMFDAAGRRVWSRDLGLLPAGPQSLTLGEADVRALPPGVYLARIAAPGTLAIGRVMRTSH